ncbi:MAG: hypothetical protein J2P25_25015 [Nocardiopsaceae bacterium]|nr:hypothetical protein [Nocardiopsaceae bacterium]
MTTLSEELLRPENLPSAVADCKALIDGEVAGKSGVSATALKAAYKVVTAFAPGYYDTVVTNLLPSFARQLDPYWKDFTDSGGSSFGDYLAKNSDAVCESLLEVTDNLAGTSSRAVIVKAYKTVRGGAGKHIEAALPNLGALMERYASPS